jgi:uncharacterized membrane protein
MRRAFFGRSLPSLLALFPLFLVVSALGQSAPPILIQQPADDGVLVTLEGNTRPEANAKYDRGPVADDFPMDHLLLLLRRSLAQQQALDQLVEGLHDPSSPSFHRWLTAQKLGEEFGVAKQDREAIKRWLQSHGFKINVDYPNGLLIDFSGTAGQVRDAFHTEIHALEVRGAKHIANISDPQIPAALAPAVEGVVSLTDFRPHRAFEPRTEYTVSENGTEHYLVVPGDLATIYNLNPLFSAGISGQAQTIVVIEDTDVYTTADWTSFRSVFGLSTFTDGSFTQIHPAPPSGANNCSDPGANVGDTEAILDSEYASAAAPSAAIVLASCTSTLTTFGGLLALQNLLNESSTPPALVSMSYGLCEASNGAASNAAFNSTFQQAVTEGVSVFVAAGDNAAAFCDKFNEDSINGIGITGWGSSPYDVAVGGTDFGDTFAGANATYWSASDSPTYESALSYVPEIPWDDSCGSILLSEFNGFSVPYGSSGFCNSALGQANYLNTIGGGGGPSGCATGKPAIAGIVGGTCAGWPKPSYQKLLGNPKDGVRDVPDLSLFAANGVWLHAYPYCFTGPGGVSCTEPPVNWPSAGGTSFAAPIMAGIQSLVNQKAGSRQGNPNYVYYKLATVEYGTHGSTGCNSTLGNAVDGTCIFYDVTQGDNAVGCASTQSLGTNDCYLPSGPTGVLSTSNSAYEPAYPAVTGWDFATGIGTVNAFNLVNNWPTDFTLTASPVSLTITQGNAGTSAISISPSNQFTGTITLSASGLPSGVTASFGTNPATTSSTLTLTASPTAATGTAFVTVTGTSGGFTSTVTIKLTVSPDYTLSASPNALTVVQGNQGTSAITITPSNGFTGSVTLSASGLPTGVTAAFSTNPATTSSTLTLTASATATTGATTVTITGTSGSFSATTTIQLAVNPPPSFTLSASPGNISVTQGTGATSAITVNPLNGFDSSVTLSATGLPTGVTAGFSVNPATSNSTLTLTASATATTGASTVTITGTSGALTETATIQLTVNPAPSFTLTANPTSLTLSQAGTGTSTITINALNGFNSSVALSASGLPAGVTASFGTNPATATSVLTLTAAATATTGTSTVTITGTSGSLTGTSTIQLTVNPAPTFTLSASPGMLTVTQGSSVTSTVTVTALNGFNSSVTLSASGFPAGVTASFGTNPAAATSVLTLTATTTATTGTTTVTVTGTSGSLTQTTTIQLTVNAAPTFKLSASPGTLTVTQGSSGTSTITVTPLNGFTSSVTLGASGLPAGVTAGFSTNPTTNSSLLTLTAAATATTGTSTVTVTGTSGSLTETTTIQLTVNAAPTFKLSASPGTLTVTQGSSGTSTVTVTPLNGFTGSVTLAASGLPAGVTASFGTNPATATSVLTLTAATTATTGTATVTVTGTAGSLTKKATIQLTVNPAPSFALSSSPNTLSVAQGGKATSTITITPANGFSGDVTLSIIGLPAGVTASFGTNPATTTSALTVTASKTAASGTTTVTITGTSGSLTKTTTIDLTVNATPSYTLSASPASLTVTQGSSVTSAITVTPANGFSGHVTLSTSGLPAGVTAAFSTNPATTDSTLTLTASATAATGTVTLTITAISGSLSVSTALTLTVQAFGNFTLTAAPSPVTITRGSSGTTVITIVPTDGFDHSVTLSVSGLPTGVTGSFNANPTTSSSTLTLKVSSSASTGVATITITGIAESVTTELGIGLIVR